MHPTEKWQSHILLEQMRSPLQVWRPRYATNYVGRPQSQQREIELGSHGYVFIATLKWHTFPALLDVTDQLQPRQIPLQQTYELLHRQVAGLLGRINQEKNYTTHRGNED